MAIVYPLDTPESIGIENITIRAVNAVATSQSPFSYKQQIISHGGQRWEADVSLPTTRKDLMAPWVSMLIALKGQTGTFLLADPDYDSPQGDVKSCLITGSTGDETVSAALNGTIKAGDYIQLGFGQAARLHKVLQDQTGSQRNLLEWSEDLSKSVYITTGTTRAAPVSTGGTDLGLDWWEYTLGSANADRFYQSIGAVEIGDVFTFSLYVDASASTIVSSGGTIGVYVGESGQYKAEITINLDDFSPIDPGPNSGPFVDKIDSGREDLGGGKYRYWVTGQALVADAVNSAWVGGFWGDDNTTTSDKLVITGFQVEGGSLSDYQKTEDAASFATDDFEIWPALRANQSSERAVLNKPKGVFRLKNNATEWSINNSSSYGLSFEAVEVIT